MNDIEKTFNRLKRLDYNDMVYVIRANGVSEYITNLDPNSWWYIAPSPRIRARYEQLCLENGWTMAEFLKEMNDIILGE